MIMKSLPRTENKTSLPLLSVIAGLAFCLLAGCGGGGSGGTTSSGTPAPNIGCPLGGDGECQIVDLPDNPDTPDDVPDDDGFLPDPVDPEDPDNMPDPPDTGTPTGSLPTGLLNENKYVRVKANRAWFFGGRSNVYTGENFVVGVMEEVNPFHFLFDPPVATDGTDLPTKIDDASILTSPYPRTAPTPATNLIAENIGALNNKLPPYPCLLQYDVPCHDQSGQTKYFLRLADGSLGLLPGLRDPNPNHRNPNERRDCPMFDLADGPMRLCSEFGAFHGTGVASVAAAYALGFRLMGNNDSSSFRGVAYEADILVYARPLHIAGLPAGFRDHANYFRNAPEEADVYNFSHTFGTPVTHVDSTFRNAIRASGFADIARAIEEQPTPIIAAAGNEGARNERFPRFPAALPAFFPDLRGKVLAVTATNDEGVITQYANWCGRLPSDWNARTHGRHYCLAAPGGVDPGNQPFWVAGPDNNQFSATAGTSFAAPVVAGAFVIVKEAFRGNMSDEDLILRLVNTADNTGQYSNSNVYGAGMLDIGAAVTPVRTNMMSVLGDINGGVTYEFDLTSLTTSAAFGDALQRAFQTREVAAFDELDAPFWYPLSSLTPTTSSRETLQERHARLFEQDIAPVETAIGGRLALKSSHIGSPEQIDMSLRQPVDILVPQAELLLTAGDLSTAPFGLHEDETFAHPYLHFAEEGIGLGGALQLGKGQLTAMGFTSSSANVARDIPVNAQGGILEYALEPLTGIEFGMQAGAITEESRALGLLSEGGFGELGESSTAFAGISLDSELEDSWRFRASMLVGRTNLDTPSIGLLKTSTTLTSSAFRFAVEGSDVFLDADRMDVFVGQPLRIENGKADFTVPVGRTPSGLVRREQINGVPLEPGGRELEFGMRYDMPVREDITATGGIGIVHEGGHSKQTETELYGLANLRFQF